MRPLDLSRPFDVQLAYAAGTQHRTKGMFFTGFVRELQALGETWPKRYVAFKEYPVSEMIDVVQALTKKRGANVPLREAWHALASNQYPALRESVVGKVMFGVVGNDAMGVLKLAARGYAVAVSGVGPVRVLEMSEGYVLAELLGQSMPLEGWHSGVWAGALESMRRQVTSVEVELTDEFNGRLALRWT